MLIASTLVALVSGSSAPALTVPLSIRVECELAAPAWESLRLETERLFAPAGIRFDWLPEGAPAQARVIVSGKPGQSVVSGCRRGLHDHRLGVAAPGARRVTLWTEHVARAIRGVWDGEEVPGVSHEELGRALGRTLAHELAHVLLEDRSHNRSGLMRAAFSQHELSARETRTLLFSSDEIEKLRARAKTLEVGAQ